MKGGRGGTNSSLKNGIGTPELKSNPDFVPLTHILFSFCAQRLLQANNKNITGKIRFTGVGISSKYKYYGGKYPF